MRNIILLAFTFIAGYFTYHFISGSAHLPGFNSSTSIAELIKTPSSFTDSTLEIEAKVIESTTVMNYTKSTISDNNGNKITLIGNKPYKEGEEINLKAHLYILYQKDGKQCSMLVDDNFKMLKGILSLLQTGLI